MIPESGSVSPSGREDWVSGRGRAQRPGAQSPRSRLCWEADSVRVGTPRPSLSSGRWQLRHRGRRCVAQPHPWALRAGGRPRVLPTQHVPPRPPCGVSSMLPGGPGRRAGRGCQLSDGLPGWPQKPHKTSPSVQGTGDPSSGSQWVLETRARRGSFIFSFGAVALIEVGGVFLRQSFLEPKFLRSEN